MSNVKKLMMTAAGGEGLDVDAVFRQEAYRGTGANPSTKTPNIDLSTEGGMVIVKGRDIARSWGVFDTVRGANNDLKLDQTNIQRNSSTRLTSFTTTGFTLKNDLDVQGNGYNYCYWVWRKAPKFFDIQTYTGNGTANRQISHNLGSVPGMIWIKSYTSTTSDWQCWHRESPNITNAPRFELNKTAKQDNGLLNHFGTGTSYVAPTSTNFTIGANNEVNNSGTSYVAYIFAHNDGDGGFGPKGNQDIIKCGRYTGNGSNDGTEVDLGFEPQFLLIKPMTISGAWSLFDTARGISNRPAEYSTDWLQFTNGTSYDFQNEYYGTHALDLQPKGFKLTAPESIINGGSQEYMYMAIRRGSLFPPEDADSCFDAFESNTEGQGTKITTGFPVDMQTQNKLPGNSLNTKLVSRLQGIQTEDTDGRTQYLSLGKTTLQSQNGSMSREWNLTGFDIPNLNNSNNYIYHSWRRAPGFFDMFTYEGNATAGRTIDHNLEAVPKMLWFKRMDNSASWTCYYQHNSSTYRKMYIDQGSSYSNIGTGDFNNTLPTDTTITFGSSAVNKNNEDMLCCLFGETAGLSKIGVYTGNSSTQNIDCGFSNGARFVMIKATSFSNSPWQVWDSDRGIVAGNDPFIRWNSTQAEVTSSDALDPYSPGFTVNGLGDINSNNEEYLFYAIAEP